MPPAAELLVVLQGCWPWCEACPTHHAVMKRPTQVQGAANPAAHVTSKLSSHQCH
jgi:hypothetical protein